MRLQPTKINRWTPDGVCNVWKKRRENFHIHHWYNQTVTFDCNLNTRNFVLPFVDECAPTPFLTKCSCPSSLLSVI
ncbi:hypothetical protein DPMN_145986 [Dreissena polymorpha]|uniref:Uncharacterized protein n=1 Tax=Dreissena polymorpha TaxID=45954 RepID=A0A9D4F525_DREPO|nr:hypothetical protein DPMN_145986 [Dreissena polymorpha]